jgi:hypothetical protein
VCAVKRETLFIRSKCDWNQVYFCLVESYRNNKGRPRQYVYHLGKTLNLSAEQWAEVLHKVEGGATERATAKVFSAVRNYAMKHGLPLEIADAVRDGARLNRQGIKERHERMRERVAHQRGYATVALLDAAEAAEKARDKAASDAYWKSFVDGFRRNIADPAGERKRRNTAAAQLLGVPFPCTLEDVNKAYRTKAQTTHPDHGGDAAQFREITAARDTLRKHLGTTKSAVSSVVSR